MDPKSKLSPEAYNVCFMKGTEAPGSGKYLHNNLPGTYSCAVCATDLFDSKSKYEAGVGWPSFWDTTSKKLINKVEDRSFGMVRTEVLCANCGSHLGHVFNDGPTEKTGLRYCINSLALEFKPE